MHFFPLYSGYAARRSKLTKSVTFNDTFTSPPKTPMNVSPLLSPLHPQEANKSENLTDDGKRFFSLTPVSESSPGTPTSSQSSKPIIAISSPNIKTKAASETSVISLTVAIPPEGSLLAPTLPPLLPVPNTSYAYLPSSSLPYSPSDNDTSSSSQTATSVTSSIAQLELSCSSVDTASRISQVNPVSNLNEASSHSTLTTCCISSTFPSSVTTSFSDLVTSSLPSGQASLPSASLCQDQHFSSGLNLNPDLIPLLNPNNIESKVNNKGKSKSKMRRKFSKKKILSNEEEYFSNILGGIKTVIEEHLVSI